MGTDAFKGPEVILYTRDYGDRALGTLYVKNAGVQLYSCRSVELPWKNNDTGESCVPAGTYPMVLEYSPAFRRKLWELKLVPGRSECKIHGANYPRQLRGCIAPASMLSDIDKDGKLDAAASGKALSEFMAAMGKAIESRITIVALDDARRLMPGMNGYR